jgi:thioredoxin reductase
VTFRAAEATHAARTDDGFVVTLGSGESLESARLVLAFGISDELPEIPGVAERWGASVLHCPYCHGYEFSGQRLGVLYLTPKSIMQSMMIAEWGPTTLFLNGANEPDDTSLAELATRGVTIERAPVIALQGEQQQLSSIELGDGRGLPLDALYIGPRTRLNSSIAQQLGCDLEDTPLGPIVRVDAERMTTVPGVYAAGDITRGAHTVTWAAADGVTAGLAVHRSLVF